MASNTKDSPPPLFRLYTGKALAERVGFSRSYISAAKKCGFKFSHGSRTTEKVFYDWLAAHPEFREKDAYPQAKVKDSKRSTSARSVLPAGNHDGRS